MQAAEHPLAGLLLAVIHEGAAEEMKTLAQSGSASASAATSRQRHSLVQVLVCSGPPQLKPQVNSGRSATASGWQPGQMLQPAEVSGPEDTASPGLSRP